MAKKKKLSKEEKAANKNDKKPSGLVYAFIGIFVVVAALIGLKAAGVLGGAPIVSAEDTQQYLERVQKAGLNEQRPLLSPDSFTGRVARGYKKAAKIPEVLDEIYCYCRCRENPRFRHKNLLTCFTDEHASGCGICLSQLEMAHKMWKKGAKIPDIRKAEDREFGHRG